MRSSGMALLLAGLMLATTAHAQTKSNGPGVSDSEIKIGQSAPFSGPASAFGIYSRVEDAYFKALNDKGGSKFNDPKQYPWTVPFYPSFEVEAAGYAKYALKAQANPKIAILYENDDYGKDFLKGFKKGLGEANQKLIVAEQSYELTDPTVDSQIINLAASGANVFLNFTTPKFAAQAIRKASELNWKPMQFVASPGSSVQAVLKVVGFDKAEGLVSALFFKEPGDPAWEKDQGIA